MNQTSIDLSQLTHLSVLFKLFNHGKHLNRLAEPALWAELEDNLNAYQTLFESLGYQLLIDGRGFAWFHSEEVRSSTSKTTRQLALLFMMLFEYQADNGKPLLHYADWLIDQSLLTALEEKNQELLTAEGLDQEGLDALWDTAARYGFACHEGNGLRLLPAVCRYLDHFEALAQQIGDEQKTDWLDTDTPDTLSQPQSGEQDTP